MNIENYTKLKEELEENIGKEKLEKIANEITETIKKNNLDVTPNAMLDIFNYIRLKILISKIWIYPWEHIFLQS